MSAGLRNGSSEEEFRAVAERVRVPGMGTEVIAPLLSHLVHLVRPERVLEVGMGYTTPFIAKALAEVDELVEAEAKALVGKNAPYLESGREFDEEWITTEPALLVPGYYREPRRSRFIAVDDLSDEYSSAAKCQDLLTELGLGGSVTVVNAKMRQCRDALPADFLPIDFAWVDAWDCLYFFENCLDLINPDGGILAMHYLKSYPEGEAILGYIADTQRIRPGEFEVLSLLESQKVRQNSITVLRRTKGAVKEYSDVGQRAKLSGGFREDAVRLAEADHQRT